MGSHTVKEIPVDVIDKTSPELSNSINTIKNNVIAYNNQFKYL